MQIVAERLAPSLERELRELPEVYELAHSRPVNAARAEEIQRQMRTIIDRLERMLSAGD